MGLRRRFSARRRNADERIGALDLRHDPCPRLGIVSCDAGYPSVLYWLHWSVLRHDQRSAVSGLDRYRWPWVRSNAGLLPPRSQEFTLKSKRGPHQLLQSMSARHFLENHWPSITIAVTATA